MLQESSCIANVNWKPSRRTRFSRNYQHCNDSHCRQCTFQFPRGKFLDYTFFHPSSLFHCYVRLFPAADCADLLLQRNIDLTPWFIVSSLERLFHINNTSKLPFNSLEFSSYISGFRQQLSHKPRSCSFNDWFYLLYFLSGCKEFSSIESQ